MIPSFASMLAVCPHDCPSCCSLVVAVSDGRLTSVTGSWRTILAADGAEAIPPFSYAGSIGLWGRRARRVGGVWG